MDNIDEYLEEKYLLAKVYKNAEIYTSSDGKQTMRFDKIDPSNIKLLEVKEIQKKDGTVEKIANIQILLPNGETEILTVNNNGEDMAVNFIGDDGISQKFMLTPRMKKEIFKYEIEANISTEEVEKALFPNSPEELEKQIAEETLIPENIIEKIKEMNPELVKEINEKKQKGKEEEEEKEQEENKQEKVNLPGHVADIVEQIKEREQANLKHVLVAKNPSSISSQLVDTAGLQDNGGPVYCLAFSSGDISSANDRVVFVQGENIIDERRYDEDATNMMNDYRQNAVVENVTDKNSKIFYTDIDGHTISADLVARPKDLRRKDKDILVQKLNDLDNKEKDILNSASLSVEEKLQKYKEINQERLKLFNEYGLDIPNIRSEVEADLEKQEEADLETQEEADLRTQGEAEEEAGDDGTGNLGKEDDEMELE